MNTRYHKYPMAPHKEAPRSPARPLRFNGTLEGVANTFGRYLPQKSRMVINTAATAQRAAQELAQSAYIRGTIAQEERRHGGPHEDPSAASGTVAAGAGLADQLQELEALLHKLSAQAAATPLPEAANPSPRMEAPQTSSPSQAVQSGQPDNSANQAAQMASLLSAMAGQQPPTNQDASNPTGTNNSQLSAMMPFLLQAMGGQSGSGAAQDPMAAMMPLLMQSMMGQQTADNGGQGNNMAAMMPLLMSAMGGQNQGAAGQGSNMAAMMPLLMSAMGGQNQGGGNSMASVLPLLMQSMGSSNH